MPTSRVFVSHSHQDNDYCSEFVAALRERGYEVWYDEHNLGWGALRATIEKEMLQCKHFIAIFSPDSVASDWVNAEIDAALDLLKEGVLQTITFVVARECVVPLLLRRWKRIEGANNASVPARVAAGRVTSILAGAPGAPGASDAPDESVPVAAPQSLPPDRLPPRLTQLGFAAQARSGVAYFIPPVCQVSAGAFLMGRPGISASDAQPAEQPQHRVALTAMDIARFPVTVAEYACFVESGHPEPRNWEMQMRRPDHPVVSISWYDATTYATWLAQLTGQMWRLPTEAEWEKAACWDVRAGVARVYPWGDSFDTLRANTLESDIGGTTSVGSYPGGASPYGAEEMAGNVWELTHSLYKPYPYSSRDGREAEFSTENRVLRGGSWIARATDARSASRTDCKPDIFHTAIGFRLALGNIL